MFKGHVLSPEDLKIRQHILNLMCTFETSWAESSMDFPERVEIIQQLTEMQQDGLLQIENDRILITEQGKPFVRNICMAFDLRLKRRKPETQIFSMTV